MDHSPPVGWLLRARLWVQCPENAIAPPGLADGHRLERTLLGSRRDDRFRSAAKDSAPPAGPGIGAVARGRVFSAAASRRTTRYRRNDAPVPCAAAGSPPDAGRR